MLKLTSSLSTSTYDYTLPEVQFTANVSYRHFTLRFDAQVCSEFLRFMIAEYVMKRCTSQFITDYMNAHLNDCRIKTYAANRPVLS